jgi:cell shape-determining protein MreC
MSYLLDKKSQRKKISQIALGVVFLVILFYFRAGIWKGLSYVSEIIFHPVLVLGHGVEGKIQDIGAYFVSKSYLYSQNQKLQAEVSFDDARMANYNSVVLDDASLKEILGRTDSKAAMTVAAILSEPNQSPYDTLLIDAGTTQGITIGDTVFALGDVPVGQISDVYPNSAKVILFSNGGETTQATISSSTVAPSATGTVSSAVSSNIFVSVVGRGGGNFEIVIPKGFVLQTGDQAVLPGINSYVLAIVQKIISDPRDSFTKALLTSPINIEGLKFVEVEE